jgi:hypothetical protein
MRKNNTLKWLVGRVNCSIINQNYILKLYSKLIKSFLFNSIGKTKVSRAESGFMSEQDKIFSSEINNNKILVYPSLKENMNELVCCANSVETILGI